MVARTFEFMETANKQLVLQFFREHPDERFTTKDLSNSLGMAKSSLSRTLNELDSMGLLHSEKEGKKKYYSMDAEMKERMDETFSNLQETRKFALMRRKEELEKELEDEE